MGTGGQIKKNLRLFVLVILMSVTMALTACGSANDTSSQPKDQKKTDQADGKDIGKASKAKQAEDIPDELLPGAQADTEDGTEDGDGSQVVDASGKGGDSQNPGSSGTSDGVKSGSNGSQSEGGSSSAGQNTISVSLSIDSSDAESYGYSVYYSDRLSLHKGATVYDVLEASGVEFAGGSYIQGIGGLFEFDCGSQSGWKYYVNGTAPDTGCKNYTLKDGDAVQWRYVLKP